MLFFCTVPTHLAQRNGVHKEEVVKLPAEARMQFLLYDEDNISWDNVGALGRKSQGVTGLLLARFGQVSASACLRVFPCAMENYAQFSWWPRATS